MALFVRATNKCLFINNYSYKLTIINTESRKLFGFSKSCLLSRCSSSIPHTTALSGQKQTSIPKETTLNAVVNKKFGSFDQFLKSRRNEAKRSIIVQVQSADSYDDLYSYCYEFGPIKSIQYYVVAKTSYFFVIEFEDEQSRIALLNTATHLNHNEIIPVQSQMLWFRNLSIKKKQKKIIDLPQLSKAKEIPSYKFMSTILMSQDSISKQMKALYEIWKLDDVGIRLRFLTAQQLESSIRSLFPNNIVLPFGSSVNGFGKMGCDLDLVLNLEANKSEKINSRLVFHTKSAMSHERAQTQRSMETISTVMQFFVPGVVNVQKILKARVPIIQYDHKLTGLECDLSMTNMTAVYMSEILYLYGEHHPYVRPLIFTIRQWASSAEITNSNPGNWITNFSLSLLVIFFLQCEEVVPSLNKLKDCAPITDIRLTDECVDCTFLRDVTKWPVMSNYSGKSLEYLLESFYNFYAIFDFSTKAISLREGFSIYKPNTSPLYICNPLEKTLNVSKNVSVKELMRFVNAVQSAATLIDRKNNADSCRLLDIFSMKKEQQKITDGRYGKKVRIAELFKPESISEDETTDTAEK